jgi:beta-lactam-binding protein with PASTA domain
LNQYGFKYKIEGPDSASVVIDQFPKPNVTVDMHHPITVKIGKSVNPKLPVVEQGVMPTLIGLTVRKALQYAAQHQINVKINGMGIVRSQSILPGSRIISGASCNIEASI